MSGPPPSGPFSAGFVEKGELVRRYIPDFQQWVRPVTGSPVLIKKCIDDRDGGKYQWVPRWVGEVYATSFSVFAGREQGRITEVNNVGIDEPWMFLNEAAAVSSLSCWVHILAHNHRPEIYFPGWTVADVIPPYTGLQVQDDTHLMENALPLKYLDMRALPDYRAVFKKGVEMAGMIYKEGVWRWP